MSTIAERYDATARAYLRWWAPVLAPTALRLLDLVAPALKSGTAAARSGPGLVERHRAGHLVDIGTGAGLLAIAAARRWPGIDVTGVDASKGMLEVARGEAGRALGRAAGRPSFILGDAASLPLPDATADAAVSSFVYQLVPDRGRALREAFRVLRPGGALAYVTWRTAAGHRFAPDDAFEDALDDAGIPDQESAEEPRCGDVASHAAAATQARRAGFRGVVARMEWLEHRFDPATYLEFLERYAERDVFEGLTEEQAGAARAATRGRLARLQPDDFVWRVPVVVLRATRPGAP